MWEQLRLILPQFEVGWRDIVDVGIIAYVFYRLILLIQGTRAEQLVKGLAILLLATVVSDQLGLEALNWLLRQTMTVGLIAIPIVFQPELRRALEALGRGRLFQRTNIFFREKEFKMLLDELLKAITVLVKRRFGALIVLERETGLKDFMETGIKVESVVTAELIINIFMPRSPLHDGAVIIRDNRIEAAGCFLPLTENPNISKDLGTRHRAAIGVSEQADAVVIVISEETGIISLANGGKITRYLDEKTLRQFLEKLCAPKPEGFKAWAGRFSQK